jgi:lipoprotein-anchoring transpeptidase ErfK/SrfK
VSGPVRAGVRLLLTLTFVLLAAGCDAFNGPTSPRRDVVGQATPAPTPVAPPPILSGDGPHAAWARGPFELFEEPGAETSVEAVEGRNPWGGTAVFGVRQAVYAGDGEAWLEIMLPRRPNGSSGWALASDFDLRPLEYEVDVSLSQRRLLVRTGDEVVRDYPVAIGAPDTPTPTGEFYITVKLQPPQISQVYGRWALGLSGYSDVLDQFGTGDGQIAIHGTQSEWSIGQATSNGCVRLTNDAITDLAGLLPQGTPVTVHA